MTRDRILEHVAGRIARVSRPHPVRVAIDGVDGAGKTMFADELVAPLRRHGRPVIRASVDGFHNPRRIRHRLGLSSPEGFFRDSFDIDAIVSSLLRPLGPDGDRRYRTAVFDYRTDSPVDSPLQKAAPDAVLLVDGIFLHRPELRAYWDFTIFLDVAFDVSVPRMARRNGSEARVESPTNRRYVEGQKLYLRACDPKTGAGIVIDNTDLANPIILSP